MENDGQLRSVKPVKFVDTHEHLISLVTKQDHLGELMTASARGSTSKRS